MARPGGTPREWEQPQRMGHGKTRKQGKRVQKKAGEWERRKEWAAGEQRLRQGRACAFRTDLRLHGSKHPSPSLKARHSGRRCFSAGVPESRFGGNSQSRSQVKAGSIQTQSASTPSDGITRKVWIPGPRGLKPPPRNDNSGRSGGCANRALPGRAGFRDPACWRTLPRNDRAAEFSGQQRRNGILLESMLAGSLDSSFTTPASRLRFQSLK